MIFQAIIGVLVLGLAVVVPFIPQHLYEEAYLEKTNTVLFSEEFASVLYEKPTTVAVTGANSGLGFASVQHLARRAVKNHHDVKMTIVMACRSLERCNKARDEIYKESKNEEKLQLVPLQLDLGDRDSIQKFAVDLQDAIPKPSEDKAPPLHAMVHNAGVCAPYPQLEYNPVYDGLETHFHVNYVGHVLLTHYVWKNVLAVHEQDPSRKARLVTVSEGGALFPVDPMKGWYAEENERHTGIFSPILNMVANMKQYARSKEAQLFFAAELQSKFPDILTTSAAQPGYTLTPIYIKDFQGFPSILKYIVGNNPLGSMTPQQGSQTILLSTLDETAQYVGPKWFFFGPPVAVSRTDNLNQGSVHHLGFSRQRTMALWDRTMKVLGIAEFGQKNYVTM